MPPTLADRVRHILTAISDIEHAFRGKTQQDYAADHFLQLAVERLLEIICEASRYIPDDVKAENSSIPWLAMVDFGNRLRHAYHRVDAAIVWNVIAYDLPPLKAFVENILRNERSA
jgi:uncharacterized protein with HEPN domain